MTREEAIRILDRRSTIPDEDASWLDIMQAINMAIEALKEQGEREKERAFAKHLRDRGY